jgi:hypothetical protein
MTNRSRLCDALKIRRQNGSVAAEPVNSSHLDDWFTREQAHNLREYWTHKLSAMESCNSVWLTSPNAVQKCVGAENRQVISALDVVIHLELSSLPAAAAEP